jgi:hypothetical protein
MPLQNRVTPDGQIVSDPQRGDLMGNRGGVLHTSDRQLAARRWVSRRWIACALAFRGRRRRVMGDGYTELFFLDEATALAAGHRPCFECRRPEAVRFADVWAEAQAMAQRPSAPAMDLVLHRDRLTPQRRKSVFEAELSTLPDGSFVHLPSDGTCYLLAQEHLLPWSFAGYGRPRRRPAGTSVHVLTPRSIVAVLSAGYRPMLHPSAGT